MRERGAGADTRDKCRKLLQRDTGDATFDRFIESRARACHTVECMCEAITVKITFSYGELVLDVYLFFCIILTNCYSIVCQCLRRSIRSTA